jgi:hypothetical protein
MFIFYKLFFPQNPSIILENAISTPITVKDFLLSDADMEAALKSSDKFQDKLAAIQKMSRMFLVYYIKFLGDSFTTEYGQMITDITAAKTEAEGKATSKATAEGPFGASMASFAMLSGLALLPMILLICGVLCVCLVSVSSAMKAQGGGGNGGRNKPEEFISDLLTDTVTDIFSDSL